MEYKYRVIFVVSFWVVFVLYEVQLDNNEQYFHVVLFIMLYKMVLTFKSLDETLVCDHSNESY